MSVNSVGDSRVPQDPSISLVPLQPATDIEAQKADLQQKLDDTNKEIDRLWSAVQEELENEQNQTGEIPKTWASPAMNEMIRKLWEKNSLQNELNKLNGLPESESPVLKYPFSTETNQAEKQRISKKEIDDLIAVIVAQMIESNTLDPVEVNRRKNKENSAKPYGLT